jgi:hypothetical protein
VQPVPGEGKSAGPQSRVAGKSVDWIGVCGGTWEGSRVSLVSQGHNWIDARGPSRGQIRRRERH